MPPIRQKQTQTVPVLGFPMMKSETIYDCLQELGVHVALEDLNKPTGPSVQNMFIQILESLTGTSAEVLDSPSHTLLSNMPYREIYTDTVSLLVLYNHCRTLIRLCNIQDFSMMDLTRPDPRNLRVILSGIMNFAKFREENHAITGALTKEAEDVRERTQFLQRKLDTVEADIQTIEAKIREEQPQTEEMMQSNQKIRDELMGLHGQNRKLQQQYEELRRQRATMNEDLDAMQRELLQLHKDTREARARIVRSPDRIKRHISEMNAQLVTDRQTLASLVAKSGDLTKRLEVYGDIEADLRGLIEIEKEAQTQRTAVHDLTRKCAELRTAVEHAKIEGESQRERVKQLERQTRNAEERVKRQQAIIRESRDEAEAKIKALKQEYVEKSKDRQIQQKRREALATQQRELEEERRRFIQESEDELNELLEQYWKLRKEAEAYMGSMNVSLGLHEYGFYPQSSL